MEERFKSLLSELGFRKSEINELFDEEHDVDPAEMAQAFRAREIPDKDSIIDLANKKMAKKVNRALGLGLSIKEAEALSLDDLADLVAEKQKVTPDDSQAMEELETLRAQLAEAKTEADEIRESAEAERQSLEEQYKAQLNSVRMENAFEKSFQNINWGVKKAWIPGFKKMLKEEVLDMYQVEPDGSLKAKDGGTAYDYKENKKRWNSIDDALEALAVDKELVKRSNGPEPGPDDSDGGEKKKEPEDRFTGPAAELRKRALAVAQKRAELDRRLSENT